MKGTSVFVAALLGVMVGAGLMSTVTARRAEAQPLGQVAPAMFQLSAYGAANSNGIAAGCYIMDTATGELWHARSGGKVEKVAAKLP